jgi:prepilin-type N-terminal cleavage/methylation domain-containing protein
MRRGFTLLEILIAMAVFTVGVISILAVFPVGIKSSTQSTDHSVAAALAESLDDALTLALRQYSGIAGGPPGVGVPVDFFHDGLPSGAGKFHLPPLETWKDTAGAIGPANVVYVANGRSHPTWYPYTPVGGTYAQALLATNAWDVAPAALGSLAGTKGGNIGGLVGETAKDFPDPLRQYSFRFMCHEYKTPNDYAADPAGDEDPNTVTTYVAPVGTHPTGGQPNYLQFEYQNGTEAEVIDRLYQFTVYVYRGWKKTRLDPTGFDAANPNCWQQGGPAPLYTWEDQMLHPNKVERFEFLIYSQGAEQLPIP